MIADTSIVPVDSVPHAWLDALAREKAFDYAMRFPPETLWERFMRWISTLLGQSVQANATWMDTVLWVLLALLVLGIVLIWLKHGNRLMGQRNLAVRGEAVDVEGIKADDMDRIIGQEIEARRWRSAIRYLYLRSLQDLQDAGAITWRKEKTNRDYLREVSATETHSAFAEAVRVFERTWYGEEALDESDFHKAKPVYDAIRHNLRTTA